MPRYGPSQTFADSAVAAFTGKMVTSINYYEIAIAGASSSNTATITSVDTSLAVIIPAGKKYGTGAFNQESIECALVLTNATTVTATRGGNSGTVTVGFYVIEFSADYVDLVEHGTVVMNAVGSNTASLSGTFTTSVSCVFYQGHSQTDTGGDGRAYVYLSDATTVTGGKADTVNNSTVSFAAVKFKTTVVNSLENNELQAVAAATDTATITSVNPAKTMLVPGGYTGHTTLFPDDNLAYFDIDDATTVSLTRVGAAGTITGRLTTIEFKDEVPFFAYSAPDIQAISSGGTDTDVPSIGTVGATLAQFLGSSSAETTAVNADHILATNTLLDANTIRSTIGATTTVDNTQKVRLNFF